VVAADFALVAGLAAVLIRTQLDQKSVVFHIAQSLFIFLILASIGLISQVYHMGGKPYQALSFWLVLITPLALFARNAFIPHLYATSLVTTAVTFWWEYDKYTEEHFAVLLLLTPFTLGALAQLTGVWRELGRFSRAFRQWFVLALVVAAAFMDVFLAEIELYRFFRDDPTRTGIQIAAVFLWGLSLPLSWRKRDRVIVGAAGAVLMLAYGLLFLGQRDQVAGALVSLTIGSCIALLCVVRGHGRFFNAMIAFLGLRFLIVYFQVFGSLAQTGVGLVVSGILIMGAAYAGFKYQKRLYHWLEGLMK
jgi:hypothetical protein